MLPPQKPLSQRPVFCMTCYWDREIPRAGLREFLRWKLVLSSLAISADCVQPRSTSAVWLSRGAHSPILLSLCHTSLKKSHMLIPSLSAFQAPTGPIGGIWLMVLPKLVSCKWPFGKLPAVVICPSRTFVESEPMQALGGMGRFYAAAQLRESPLCCLCACRP